MAFVVRALARVAPAPHQHAVLSAVRCIATTAPAMSSSSSSSNPSPTQQPVQFKPREMTEELVRKIGEVDTAMRVAYDRIPEQFPAHAQPTDQAPLDKQGVFRKRLLYRSKQRGWLEVDLLLGTWATEHLHTLNEEELKQYEQLLNRETIDIYNFMTGKDTLPAELQNPLMARIQDWCNKHPLGRADPAGYAKVKTVMSN